MLKNIFAVVSVARVALLFCAAFAIAETIGTTHASVDQAVAIRSHQRRTTERFFERATPTQPGMNSVPKATPHPADHHTHRQPGRLV